jgi:SIR2-like domain
MDLATLKSTIQKHMSDGLVTIVGSGLSCAEGLPSMGVLADQLESTMPSLLSPPLLEEWSTVAPSIRDCGLEDGLSKTPPSTNLEDAIRAEVGRIVSEAEAGVIAEVFQGKRVLRFTRLLKHLLMPKDGMQVVTTNYDRLLEVAAEEAGLGVDVMFNGVFSGNLNQRETRLSFCRNVDLYKGKTPRFHYADRVVISKPHGSLDWYDRNGQPVRHAGNLKLVNRLIIPPGQNKYRNGYSSPFDVHRERGNKEIDRAARFLIIGYGFNDVHLETHLKDRIKRGIPTLIVARDLTSNTKKVCDANPAVIALEHAVVKDIPATRVYSAGNIDVFAGKSFWDLNHLVKEVFEP